LLICDFVAKKMSCLRRRVSDQGFWFGQLKLELITQPLLYMLLDFFRFGAWASKSKHKVG